MSGADNEVRRLLAPLRHVLASSLTSAVRAGPDELAEYEGPLGDPGLFGPTSLAWVVHADLPAMLIGGLGALMFQTLHPLAMAGVAEHSRFKDDPIGRLQRTARFVAGTTFGASPFAEQLLAEVKRVHDHVQGIAPDGRVYSANNPALLTWVHTTEVFCLLRSFQRYGARPLLRHEKDAYVSEMALIARRLGANEVPTSVAEVRNYLRAISPELTATPEAIDTVAFLRRSVSRRPEAVLAHRIMADAAFDLLPGYARSSFGALALPLISTGAVRIAGASLAAALRWAIGPSVLEAIAARRSGAPELAELRR